MEGSLDIADDGAATASIRVRNIGQISIPENTNFLVLSGWELDAAIVVPSPTQNLDLDTVNFTAAARGDIAIGGSTGFVAHVAGVMWQASGRP